jgi:anti-anti-sigma factor
MTSRSGIGVIALNGELDLTRRAELHEALHISNAHDAVLIDLASVTYADSSILSELLRFRAEATTHNVRVALLLGSRQLARLIQYAGLGEAFAVFDDRGAALTYLAGTDA